MNEEHKDIFVSVELIKDICSEEVSYTLKESFGFDYEKDHNFYEIPRSFGRADAEPIDIDEAISILQELKDKNSTHVQIEYHVGHREYIFSGMRIELATDELIEKYKKHQQELEREELEVAIKLKQLEIQELKHRIKKL
jgi:hypothetical protein